MEYEYLSVAIASGRACHVVPRWAVSVLRDVADGRRGLRAAVHPLGFTCLPVIRYGHYGVCVHVWPSGQPSPRPPATQVHAHSWDLVSYVLFGQLRNELPRVLDADAAHPRAMRVLEVRSRGDTDDIVPTARLVRCEAGVSELAVPDDVYTVPAGTFHSSSVGGRAGVTATVALGMMVSGGADLSLGDPRSGTRRVRRARLGTRPTQDLARMVADWSVTAARHRSRP